MNLNIEHRACYEFDMPMAYTIQQLHLTPQDGFGQRVKNWDIRVNGKLQSYADAFGNTTHTLVSFLYIFGITRMRAGFGSAISVVIFVMCVVVAFGYKRIFMRND